MQALAGLFIAIGIGVNAGFVLLHTWLPDAYPRAHFAASVFLSVYTTKTAVYLLARAQPGGETIALMGALMAVYGVTFAVFQNDMRRLLSYHIISQVGYMVAGVGIFAWLGAGSESACWSFGGDGHVFNTSFTRRSFHDDRRHRLEDGENCYRESRPPGKMPVTRLHYARRILDSGVPPHGFVSNGMVLFAAKSPRADLDS